MTMCMCWWQGIENILKLGEEDKEKSGAEMNDFSRLVEEADGIVENDNIEIIELQQHIERIRQVLSLDPAADGTRTQQLAAFEQINSNKFLAHYPHLPMSLQIRGPLLAARKRNLDIEVQALVERLCSDHKDHRLLGDILRSELPDAINDEDNELFNNHLRTLAQIPPDILLWKCLEIDKILGQGMSTFGSDQTLHDACLLLRGFFHSARQDPDYLKKTEIILDGKAIKVRSIDAQNRLKRSLLFYREIISKRTLLDVLRMTPSWATTLFYGARFRKFL